MLTPFLRCGHCGGRVIVVASARKDARTWLYFCGTRRDNKAACPGVSVRVDTLDPKVLDAIEQQVLEPENIKELIGDTLEALNAADGDHAAAERERLTALIGEFDRKIRLAATHAINGMIDEDDAKAITAPLVAQRDRARLELAALPARAEVPTADRVDPAKFREAILAAWRERPLEERREALAKVLDTITLEPGGVTVRYDAAEYCGAQRIGSLNHTKSYYLPAVLIVTGSPFITRCTQYVHSSRAMWRSVAQTLGGWT